LGDDAFARHPIRVDAEDVPQAGSATLECGLRVLPLQALHRRHGDLADTRADHHANDSLPMQPAACFGVLGEDGITRKRGVEMTGGDLKTESLLMGQFERGDDIRSPSVGDDHTLA
jgi:hypothetical protein